MDGVGLFGLGKKGVATLSGLIESGLQVNAVVVGTDNNIQKDYSEELASLAQSNSIPIFSRDDFTPDKTTVYVAAGWRWMIHGVKQKNLVVFHDSLLPKYRGFAPLVNSLINGEEQIGVTALFASEQYDEGPIIAQKSVAAMYPLKIADAIERVASLYYDLAAELGRLLLSQQQIHSETQNHQEATYSVWRDNEDYKIDWSMSCDEICRFVDAVGFPYDGAKTHIGSSEYVVLKAKPLYQYVFEVTHPGKVFRIENDLPLVISGKGAVQILDMRSVETGKSAIPWKKMRVRFQ